MKKYIIIAILAAVSAVFPLKAQDVVLPNPEAPVTDTIPAIFADMPETVTLNQPSAVRDSFQCAVAAKVVNKQQNKVKGNFSIRIYSDSGQSAREVSSQILSRFVRQFPGTPATRTYNSPYFMVTVGKYEDRREAEKALSKIRPAFPRAFIVKR